MPGPFEYDVKRMTASFVIAGRNNGFTKADARAAALAAVAEYRAAMAGFASMPTMDIWYASFDEDRFKKTIQQGLAEATPEVREKKAKGEERKEPPEAKLARQAARRAEKNLAKAHTRDSVQALARLGEIVDGAYRIVSQPPVIVPARELHSAFGLSADEVMATLVRDSCGPTGPRCPMTGASCSSGSRSSTRPAR